MTGRRTKGFSSGNKTKDEKVGDTGEVGKEGATREPEDGPE